MNVDLKLIVESLLMKNQELLLKELAASCRSVLSYSGSQIRLLVDRDDKQPVMLVQRY